MKHAGLDVVLVLGSLLAGGSLGYWAGRRAVLAPHIEAEPLPAGRRDLA